MWLKQTGSAFRKKLCIVARRWHYLLSYAVSQLDYVRFFAGADLCSKTPLQGLSFTSGLSRATVTGPSCSLAMGLLARTARDRLRWAWPAVGPAAEWTHHGLLPAEEEIPCTTPPSGIAAGVWSHVLEYLWSHLVLANFKGQPITFPETHTSNIGHGVGFAGFSYEISSCTGDAAAKMTTNLSAQLSNICSLSIHNIVP